MNTKGITVALAALLATAGAAEASVPLDAIKYTATILGAVYTVGKIIHAVLNWGEKQVKVAVREEMNRRFLTLPCVQDKTQSEGGCHVDVQAE